MEPSVILDAQGDLMQREWVDPLPESVRVAIFEWLCQPPIRRAMRKASVKTSSATDPEALEIIFREAPGGSVAKITYAMLRKRRVRRTIASFVVKRYGESWKAAIKDL